MQTRRIGTLDVSLLGLGTGRLASLGAGHSRADAERLFDVASELGVNFIDTADSYGAGACERLVGGLLKGRRRNFSSPARRATLLPICRGRCRR